MIHAAPARLDVGSFWHVAPRVFGAALGTNLHIGRYAYSYMKDFPVDDIHVDYAIVDTERVPRETFAAIFVAWRDGYAEELAKYLGLPVPDVRAHFDATIECIRTGYAVWFVPTVPDVRAHFDATIECIRTGYAVWFVPIVTARRV
jgi:hypothetical protein